MGLRRRASAGCQLRALPRPELASCQRLPLRGSASGADNLVIGAMADSYRSSSTQLTVAAHATAHSVDENTSVGLPTVPLDPHLQGARGGLRSLAARGSSNASTLSSHPPSQDSSQGSSRGPS